MEYDVELVNQLSVIRDRFGLEFFLEVNRCTSVYGDLYPQNPKYKRLLEMVLNTNLAMKLLSPISQADLHSVAYKGFEEIVRRYFIDAHDAAIIVNCLIKTFGYDECLDVPEISKKEELTQIEPYKFCGKTYSDYVSLLRALGVSWKLGKQELKKDEMLDYFRNSRNKAFYERIKRAHNSLSVCSNDANIDSDVAFCSFLYDGIGPAEFIWQDIVSPNLESYVASLNKKLRENDVNVVNECGKLLANKVFSNYLRFQSGVATEKIQRIEECEHEYFKAKLSKEKKEIVARVGVELIDRKFEYNRRLLTDPMEILNDILAAAATSNRSSLDTVSDNIILNGNVDVVFMAWLKVLQLDDKVKKFLRR